MKLKAEIRNTFNQHAAEYEQVAEVQHEIGQRLFDRLQYFKIQPRYVLDVGCGPGVFTEKLKKAYPKAQIVGVDLAWNMLQLSQDKQRWRRTWSLVNGDMSMLPFSSGQFDLVFSNQVIHWGPSLATVFREFSRVMRPDGCLMFSTLGPDTFQELRQSFQVADSFAHVNAFLDMHDIGDCLLHEKFIDPVMDMEILTAHYSTLADLLAGLRAQGVRNIHGNRNPGLTGKDAWHKFEQKILSFLTPEQKLPLTYEVLYGHAWKGMQSRTEQGVETYVAVDTLRAGGIS